MASKNILAALNGLVKKAADEKSARLAKKASPGDGVDDGTSKPQTGEQMAKNKEMAAKGTAAKVDGGAKTNPVGGSVENSTEGAAAVATSGQEGAKGAVLEKKHDAPNGPEGGIKSASLIEQLRKAASDEGATAVAAPGEEENSAVKFLKKAFEKKASALDRFLADWARKNIKSAGALDDPAAAQAGADQMGQQAQGPQGEEQAEQMLLQMAQSGAITEQDLIQAMQELHQAQGGGDAGAGAGAPPAPPMAGGPGPDAGAGAPPAPPADGGQMADPALEAKMAAADIGPDHPEYIQKLAALYSEEVNAGYMVAVKVAEELADEAAHDDKPADEPPKGDVGLASPADAGAPPAPPAAPGAPANGDPMGGLQPVTEEQKAALLHVLTEMGITPDQLKQLLSEAPAAPAAPADPKLAAVAEYRVKVRNLIMDKMAAVMEADASAAPAK